MPAAFLGNLVSAYGTWRQAEMGRDWSSAEAGINREYSSAEAQRNRDFQERMAGSAHQREVDDLRKAGLNPLLSGTGGMGSVSPAGSMASGSMPSASSPTFHELGSSSVNSSLAAKRNASEIELLQSQSAKQKAEALVIAATMPGVLADNSAKANYAKLSGLEASKQEVVKYLYGKGGKLIDKFDPLVDRLIKLLPQADVPASAGSIFRTGPEIRERMSNDVSGFFDSIKSSMRSKRSAFEASRK